MTTASVDAAGTVITGNDQSERLAALFDAHADRLFRLGRRLVGTADDANDLVQDTFIRAAKSVRSIPLGRASEEAWLVRVMLNIQKDAWRRANVRNRAAATFGTASADQASTVESTFAVHRAVWNALDRLAPRRRAVVVMHELEGTDIPVIARLLGISAITVRWHLSMARRDLRTILRPIMEEAK